MSYMIEQERCRIENLLNAGVSPRVIAQKLKQSHTTILREIRKHRSENEADVKRKKNFGILQHIPIIDPNLQI